MGAQPLQEGLGPPRNTPGSGFSCQTPDGHPKLSGDRQKRRNHHPPTPKHTYTQSRFVMHFTSTFPSHGQDRDSRHRGAEGHTGTQEVQRQDPIHKGSCRLRNAAVGERREGRLSAAPTEQEERARENPHARCSFQGPVVPQGAKKSYCHQWVRYKQTNSTETQSGYGELPRTPIL